MAKCENCGCGMSGGFCSNCHEEVFIAEQYNEMGEPVPLNISQKVNEHISDPNRIKMAKKIRESEREQIRKKHFEFFGEHSKN